MSEPLLSGPHRVWTVSADRTQLVGECGCVVKNTLGGLFATGNHECSGDIGE